MSFIQETLSSKDVIDNWKYQVYEITHVASNMRYVGCVYSFGKWYLERFREHILGFSSSFEELYQLGIANKGDEFTCRLVKLVESKDVSIARQLENAYIAELPRHLSINYLVGSHQEFRQGQISKIKELKDKGYCIKRFLSDLESTPLQLQIDQLVSSKSDLYHLRKSYETIVGVITTKGWKEGRRKMAERKGSGKLTESEKEAYAKLPKRISDDWKSRDSTYVASRTSPGLNAMNSTLTCHCGKTLSRGNYARYHGAKCKSSQYVN